MASKNFLVLYGSETGTSQDVAERIWREGKMMGLKGPVLPMDDYDVTKLIYEEVVVFVCSTTGQGEPPINMRKFWRFLLRKNLPSNSLTNVRFGVLALGDSSYVKFNHTGKKLYRRLISLGGTAMLDIGLADDQHDLGPDAVIDPWIAELWQKFINESPSLKLPDMNVMPPPKWKVRVLNEDQKKEFVWPVSPTSFPVSVISNVRTTPSQHFQSVHLIKFGRREEDLVYESGDVAMVRPSNSKDAVNNLITALGGLDRFCKSNVSTDRELVIGVEESDPDMPVPVQLSKAVSFRKLASHYWDLNASPRRYVFWLLSRFTEDPLEKEKLVELASPEGQEEMFSYCFRPRRTIVEVLADFPHASSLIPLEYLFDIFLPIRPRYFSIASPPQNQYIEILVAVVKYKTKLYKPRIGLCSTWLASLKVGTVVDMAIKKGTLKFYPTNHIIMVGPGTGIAPFRSYICGISEKEEQSMFSLRSESEMYWSSISGDDRSTMSITNPVHRLTLVFGCRNSKSDFHFSSDLTSANLNLFTAFSRDQPHKIYVQHKIAENANFFSDLLRKNDCIVMVAGNAKDMPEAVKQEFINCISLNMSQKEAKKLIENMEKCGRYQTETWS